MRRLALITAAAALAISPAQANTVSLRLIAIIPISCAVDVTGGEIQGHRISLSVRRNCNTSHSLVLSSAITESLGEVTLRYNGRAMRMGSDFEMIDQPERYYDGVDLIIVEVSKGSSEDLRQYAQSLNVGVETV